MLRDRRQHNDPGHRKGAHGEPARPQRPERAGGALDAAGGAALPGLRLWRPVLRLDVQRRPAALQQLRQRRGHAREPLRLCRAQSGRGPAALPGRDRGNAQPSRGAQGRGGHGRGHIPGAHGQRHERDTPRHGRVLRARLHAGRHTRHVSVQRELSGHRAPGADRLFRVHGL